MALYYWLPKKVPMPSLTITKSVTRSNLIIILVNAGRISQAPILKAKGRQHHVQRYHMKHKLDSPAIKSER